MYEKQIIKRKFDKVSITAVFFRTVSFWSDYYFSIVQSKPILERAIYRSLFSDYVFSFVNAGIKQDFQQYLGGLDPRQIQQLMKIMFDIRQVSKSVPHDVPKLQSG